MYQRSQNERGREGWNTPEPGGLQVSRPSGLAWKAFLGGRGNLGFGLLLAWHLGNTHFSPCVFLRALFLPTSSLEMFYDTLKFM